MAHMTETQRNAKRRSLFDAQDQIDKRREKIIEDIERKSTQQLGSNQLFTARWILG